MADLINENVQTFAYSLIPNRGLPIDRSTIVKDEAELIEFVKRGWIVNGTKTFISERGKSFTVLLDESKENGFESVEELDSTQVTELATTIVEDYAPSKDELKEVSDKVVEVESSVSTVRSELESQIAETSNQLTSFKSDYESDKETFATKESVKEQIQNADLEKYALKTDVETLNSDTLSYVEQTYLKISEFNEESEKFASASLVSGIDDNVTQINSTLQEHLLKYNELLSLYNNLESRVTILEAAVETSVKAPSNCEFSIYINDTKFESISSKYGTKITHILPTWNAGMLSEITSIELTINDEQVDVFSSPTSGEVLELTNEYTITEDTTVIAKFIRDNVATVASPVANVGCIPLEGPSITQVQLYDTDGNIYTGSTNAVPGTVLSRARITYHSGDSTEYEASVLGTTASGACTMNTYSNTVDVDFTDTSVSSEIGGTVEIPVTLTDKLNDTVEPVTQTIVITTKENSYTFYYGVEGASKVTQSSFTDGTLTSSSAVSGDTVSGLTFKNDDYYTYVVLYPETLELSKIEYFDDIQNTWSDVSTEFDLTSGTIVDSLGTKYTIARRESSYIDNQFRVTF